ncbi:DNA mismatch repair endonuclease MutL [Candidatus Chlamydia sanziniae]|uniref:DNA mismatch repair protein MutL n=1 Tax=Candidatus Chlamydia sanziniae TaxID=1806891 RepID=A0A1A9HWY9_9CHLA|nr:DNA mismatch repair endonuclease MutL [Candidatus Chlamydia sanziniae]ANH78612.1 DNA mismatch repair protein MutL [Candidatus Chlamydia sanziniae]
MSLRRSIQLLDTTTINQIAAGEVIANAASVVKELVENSLDAEADEVEVETLGGGQGTIVVKDNGCGMAVADVLLALQRHATSKIGAFSDLFSLKSFGFRGEGLPSIASICKMEIQSSLRGGEGSRTVIHGGNVVFSEPFARQTGTTILVHSLFYNVPVRKDFQKSPQADRVAIRKLLENCVLTTGHVGWSWISEGNRELHISKYQQFEDRVAFVMGEGFMQEALKIDVENDMMRIVGFLGSPNFHRPTRQGQKIFVNDRPIDSLFISRIVGEVYTLVLPLQRYPVFVLKLYLPPAWCDFNVHPQKAEVRLLKEDIIGEKLKEALIEVLTLPQGIRECREFLIVDDVDKELQCIPTVSLWEEHKGNSSSGFSYSPSLPMDSVPLVVEVHKEKSQGLPMQMDWLGSRNVRFLTSLGRVVLAEDLEGVHVIFTAAARKHLFYLSLVGEERPIYKTQMLLLPVQLQVTTQEALFFSLYTQELSRLGIGISQIGPNNFTIESAPSFINEEELKAWILMLAAGSTTNIESKGLSHVIKETLARAVFSKNSQIFDVSWLALLWAVGKPEKGFDGTQICRILLDSDFI